MLHVSFKISVFLPSAPKDNFAAATPVLCSPNHFVHMDCTETGHENTAEDENKNKTTQKTSLWFNTSILYFHLLPRQKIKLIWLMGLHTCCHPIQIMWWFLGGYNKIVPFMHSLMHSGECVTLYNCILKLSIHRAVNEKVKHWWLRSKFSQQNVCAFMKDVKEN